MTSVPSSEGNGAEAPGESAMALAVRQRRHAVKARQEREEHERQIREAELEKERERRRRSGAHRHALSLNMHARFIERRNRDVVWGQDAQGMLNRKRLRQLQHRLITQTPPFGTLEYYEYMKQREDPLLALISVRVAPAEARAERRRWARALRARPAPLSSVRCRMSLANDMDDVSSCGVAAMSLPLGAPENMGDYEFYCRLLAWRELTQISDARREVCFRQNQLRVALDQELTLLEQDYAAARQHLSRIVLALNAAKQAEAESKVLALMGSNGCSASKGAKMYVRGSNANRSNVGAESSASYEALMSTLPPYLLRLFRGGHAPATRTRRGRNGGSAAGHFALSDAGSAAGDLNGVVSNNRTSGAANNGAAGATGETPAIVTPSDAEVWIPITTPGMMLSESVRSLAMPPVRAPASWLRSSALVGLVASGSFMPETTETAVEEQPRIRVALDAPEIQRDMRQVTNGIRSLERARKQNQEGKS
ncbi:hypothetical protein CCYA_CCYA14G3732 [Cyanidiococcus yangmingshanensis]|nr:hypothetical protein CCYA_CCYA14G3732 [Cyanidiococcus yangmingshanensis]